MESGDKDEVMTESELRNKFKDSLFKSSSKKQKKSQ